MPGIPPPTNPDWDKKIVKTAVLNGEVNDFRKFSADLPGKVKKWGGYISAEVQSETDGKIGNSVVIKVPADQFENLLAELSNSVVKVNEKKVTSDDVTTQLIDGRSRLEAKKQVRLRYLDLLRQARNMEEILTVQKEINAIQEEIESVSGRLNFIGHAAAMSTIEFTFFQVLDRMALQPKEESFLERISVSFVNGWRWVQGVFIGLVAIWPLFVLAIMGYAFYKRSQAVKAK